MGAVKLFAIVFVLHLFLSVALSITIEKNAYKGIYISSSGGWTDENLQKLQEVLKKSSEYLFHATRRRSYFGEFIFSDAWCSTPPSAIPSRVDVYVAPDSNPRLRTQHSRGCGEPGEVMYMPLSWLRGDTEELAREFIQQWSIYRYGIFEEDPIYSGSCYRSKDSWNAVGCYDRKKVPEISPEFENGLPSCFIDSNDTSGFLNLKSSLMFTSNISKASDFCDGSSTFPHDPAMPTLHNNLCEGKTTWSVIENSQDFKFGKNKPLMLTNSPTPKFTGFCQNNLRLTFAIQNNTSGKDLTEAVAEIGYSLYQYLLNLRDLSGSSTKPEVNVVMFSDKDDNSGPLKLDISAENLKNEIVDYVKAFRVVTSNCVSCGFRKALDASKGPSTVVVVAWENTIGEEDVSEILKVLRTSSSRIHLLLVENTEADVLSAELISAIRSTGGQISILPRRLVAMASAMHAVLSTVVKSPLRVEDEEAVVHEAVFENVEGSFTDSFTTLNPEDGTLEYLIHCYPLNRIVPSNQNCILTSSNIDTYKCKEELEPNKIKLWELHHTDKGGTKPPNCSSVAILHNRLSTSKEKLTLKGWLSNYATEPGKAPLIVYAEIIGSSEDYHVKAEISGSDGFLVSMELRDNGNGDPDVKRGDGIFSRYFTPLSLKKGSYAVKIFAESKVEITDKFYANEPLKNNKVRRQSKSIGFFSVLNTFPEEDIFPPSRVGDLRVISYDKDNGTVTLQWTAPGNDYDYGTAETYQVYFSEDWKDLQDEMLQKTPPNRLASLETNHPKVAGEESRSTFNLSMPEKNNAVYIALRAVDASQNKGRISNVIQIVDYRPDMNETNDLANDTDPTTGGELEISEDGYIHKCYYILGGVCSIILLIILINITIWILCFRKLKQNIRNHDDMKDIKIENGNNLKEIVNQKNAHSYVNPIMNEYTSVNAAAGNSPSTQTSVLYTKVSKQRTRNTKESEENLEEGTLSRHNERDLGLV